MISRILNRAVSRIVQVNMYRMGGGHHDHHHQVKLDRETNWVSYSGDQALASNKFVSLTGFKDTYPAHEQQENPFPHLQNASFFSLHNLLYNDPFHHEQDHDPLYNEPHGYLIGDDPMESRWNFSYPCLVYIIVMHLAIMTISFMLKKGIAKNPEKKLQEDTVVVELIEDQLTELKQHVKHLREVKAKLLEKLEH